MIGLKVDIMNNDYEEKIQTKIYTTKEKADNAMEEISKALNTLCNHNIIKTYNCWILTEETTKKYIEKEF